ncbi:hypothetical protein Mpsy_1046 [Methanolobus psychrophilus R15]|nr:hypothetical protein Mpsy_1046 [Methanolobus psychrophilus R15]
MKSQKHNIFVLQKILLFHTLSFFGRWVTILYFLKSGVFL